MTLNCVLTADEVAELIVYSVLSIARKDSFQRSA